MWCYFAFGGSSCWGEKPERWTGFGWVDSGYFKELQGGYLQAIKDGNKNDAFDYLTKLIDKMPEDNSVRVDFYLPAKFRLQAELGKSKLEQLETVVEYVDRVFAYAKRPGYKKLSPKSLKKAEDHLLPLFDEVSIGVEAGELEVLDRAAKVLNTFIPKLSDKRFSIADEKIEDVVKKMSESVAKALVNKIKGIVEEKIVRPLGKIKIYKGFIDLPTEVEDKVYGYLYNVDNLVKVTKEIDALKFLVDAGKDFTKVTPEEIGKRAIQLGIKLADKDVQKVLGCSYDDLKLAIFSGIKEKLNLIAQGGITDSLEKLGVYREYIAAEKLWKEKIGLGGVLASKDKIDEIASSIENLRKLLGLLNLKKKFLNQEKIEAIMGLAKTLKINLSDRDVRKVFGYKMGKAIYIIVKYILFALEKRENFEVYEDYLDASQEVKDKVKALLRNALKVVLIEKLEGLEELVKLLDKFVRGGEDASEKEIDKIIVLADGLGIKFLTGDRMAKVLFARIYGEKSDNLDNLVDKMNKRIKLRVEKVQIKDRLNGISDETLPLDKVMILMEYKAFIDEDPAFKDLVELPDRFSEDMDNLVVILDEIKRSKPDLNKIKLFVSKLGINVDDEEVRKVLGIGDWILQAYKKAEEALEALSGYEGKSILEKIEALMGYMDMDHPTKRLVDFPKGLYKDLSLLSMLRTELNNIQTASVSKIIQFANSFGIELGEVDDIEDSGLFKVLKLVGDKSLMDNDLKELVESVWDKLETE